MNLAPAGHLALHRSFLRTILTRDCFVRQNGVVTTIAAVLTEKGGVGKTTVTLGLASAAMAANKRVLVVDMDPQSSATDVLGIYPSKSVGVLRAALDGEDAAPHIMESSWSDQVWVLPGHRQQREWVNVGNARVQATRLARALSTVADGFDLILIDCPPGLGDNVLMSLAAAKRAVLVAEPSVFSVRAIVPVADLIDDVWQRYNQDLDLAGVIVNRVPPKSTEAQRQFEEIGDLVGRSSVWAPVVPQRVLLAQAAADRRPIHSYGNKAADLIEVFDKLYRKLRRS